MRLKSLLQTHTVLHNLFALVQAADSTDDGYADDEYNIVIQIPVVVYSQIR